MAGAARGAARVLVVTRIAVPTALVLVEDSAGGELPLAIPGQLVAASSHLASNTPAEPTVAHHRRRRGPPPVSAR